MPEELRRTFHRALDEIDAKVRQLFALVSECVVAATEAFLASDRDTAKALMDRDALIDSLYADVETLAQEQFALQSPMAQDMRFLLTILRVVPELERSGDLAEHIARRALPGMASELTPRMRGLIEQMGRVGGEMWRLAADGYGDRDPDIAEHIEERDDELDELHASLTAELASGSLTVPVAMEMTLVARFYERLGDHAVNVAQRIRFLAVGI